MSTSTFIDQLYSKFLFRTADTNGKDYWTTQIDNGMTASDVAKSFIDSTEYQNSVASLSKLYFLVFDRLPDFDGLQYWVNEGQAGSTVAQIANSFVVSNEFQTAYGAAVTNDAFMDLLYQNAFSRASDADGKAYWVAEMEKGMSRADVVASFAVSDEFHAVAGGNVQTTSIYYGILDRIPSTDELNSAPTDTLQLITNLFASSEYTGQTIGQTISGKVIDGYITGATVFLDQDGDGVLDANEVSTLTDADGDFTLSGNGSLVATGGTDISTGLAFNGVFKAPSGSTVINPVTTLIQAIIEKGQTANDATLTVSSALGLDTSVDLTTYDPIAEATNANANTQTKQQALNIQSVNLQVANMLTQASAVMQGATGDQLSVKVAMQATVDALADQINTNNGNTALNLSSTTVLQQTLNLAAEKARDSISDTNIANELTSKVAGLADEAATMLSDANSTIAQVLGSANPADVIGALESAVKIQTVAQGSATQAIKDGASNGSLTDAVNSYSGAALQGHADNVVVDTDSLVGGAGTSTGGQTGGGAGGSSGGGATAPAIQVSWSATSFVEASANNGAISTVATLTLSGNETFAGTTGQALSGAVVTNVPTGLTAVVTKTGDKTATLAFTGSADAHENVNDVSNLTVTLGNDAFTGGNAAAVSGATTSNLAINFSDADSIELNYDTTTFTEAAANDGTITATSTLTLTGDTFSGANGQAISDAVFSNVPAGLSASLVKTSDTTATLSFSGAATTHANANDINNLTVALGDSAFLNSNAADVTGSTNSTLAIDFADPLVKSLAYSATSFAEATANDGSITSTVTLTLTNETFTGANGQAVAGVSFTNVPAGLSASLVKSSDTTATLSFTGSASAHANANDVNNLAVTFSDTSFVGADAASVTGASVNNLAIDFADPISKSVAYSATEFVEAAANDGSIATTATLTLTNETFTGTNGQQISGVNFTSVPTGLIASLVKVNDTTATLSFTGNAAAHANANDVSDFTVALTDAAFVGADASSVSGASSGNLAINFSDPRSVSYGRDHFTEAATNNGSIGVSSTLTITGDTFTGTNGSALAGATVNNVPGGLTASLVRTSDTTATLSFSGTASAHANINDLSNVSVTLADAAFTGGNASAVTGASNTVSIDFADIGAAITGDSSANILLGTGADDIIYGAGGADVINSAQGDDTIDITDASSASATIAITETTNGLDTIIGFAGGSTGSGGDVLDFSSIANLSDSVATSVSTSSDFANNNVFIFNSTAISIAQAASAIAADTDVTATTGYIVIADSANNNIVTVYHSDNLNNDGAETALVALSGISIDALTANNILV